MNAGVKHIVDAYDDINDVGIEFQHSPISVEAIQSRDATTHLDWIFNVTGQFMRKVKIGNRIVCEIPHSNWEDAVKAVKHTVYLFTGFREWILLEDRETYRIEVDGKIRNVWRGKPYSFQKLYDDTSIQNMLTAEGLAYFDGITAEMEKVPIIYGRCKKSMKLLDDIHRRYVYKHPFQPNEIVGIKSVAGSGKTTTLLELAKIHADKKILYLAFNKALITEIKEKIQKQAIQNLYPSTFHSLIHGACPKKGDVVDLRPQNIHKYVPWLFDKPYKLKQYYVDLYKKFCRSTIESPHAFCKSYYGEDKPMLHTLWSNTELVTFDSLLKQSLVHRWLKGYIDATYDMIMIDETQDFDALMLQMLLNDTTIPKLFVGDPKQSIYQWRGCINAFNHLPAHSLIVEFYSTFRIGDPACEIIRNKFKDCWMISKSKYTTILTKDVDSIADKPYTYLFRSWRRLLTTARTMQKVWICNYEQQMDKIRKLHPVISKVSGEEFEDDLPSFLKSLSKEDLEELISDIERNIVAKEEARYKFYTIHAYKGLEDDIVRIANDIDTEDDSNLYYVALTRGMQTIVEEGQKEKGKEKSIVPIGKGYIYDWLNGKDCWSKPFR
jgi:hypothetical protein